MKILFLIFMLSTSAWSREIEKAFKNRDYKRVTELHKRDQEGNYSKKELVMISYSLRKMKFFRQDIKLNIRLIKRHHHASHLKLLGDIRNKESVDPDEYTAAIKILYWNIYNDHVEIILGYSELSENLSKDVRYFNAYYNILSKLEFREGKADKINDRIQQHVQHLANKIYKSSRSFSLQYMSWQSEATLRDQVQGSDTGLVITNRGYCLGGDLGVENYRYHFYVDGCFLYGAGGVSSYGNSPVKYQQSDVPAYGLKMGPGASMIISSSKSRIGFRLPIIYSIQRLTNPSDPGYAIKEESPLSFVGSLYSRWQLGEWYFQTEFGKYIQAEETFWGLGVGKKF